MGKQLTIGTTILSDDKPVPAAVLHATCTLEIAFGPCLPLSRLTVNYTFLEFLDVSAVLHFRE